jgi:serine/threonine protein kinase
VGHQWVRKLARARFQKQRRRLEAPHKRPWNPKPNDGLTHTLRRNARRDCKRALALALSKLNHPNIAAIYDFDTQDGVDFIVMENVEGARLAEKLEAGRLPEKEAKSVGAQIAEALQ